MRIAYFAHDLSDPSIARRVRMLRSGGADIRLAGFRRSPKTVETVAGVVATDFGRTDEGRLGKRALDVAARAVMAGRLRHLVADADALLCRNLEMGAIACAALRWARSSTPLNYECLDIHHSVLGDQLFARTLRVIERRVLRRASRLMLSSPGFVDNYFAKLGVALPEILLVENKRFTAEARTCTPTPPLPWRISWLGLLRCRKSFDLLLKAAAALGGRIDIELRGAPTSALRQLIDAHLPLSNMRFLGPYEQAELGGIYTSSHFAWGVDYFQAGANSDWLLPNRLYESSFFGLPMIALAGTQIARWLSACHIGVTMRNPDDELVPFFERLDSEGYDAMRKSVSTVPDAAVVFSERDCRSLVSSLCAA